MNDRHSTLDRLEARLEHQTARIDELYRLLEERGVARVTVAPHRRSRRPVPPAGARGRTAR